MEKYRDWDILDELPKDWIIDKTAGSPCPNTVFITNGKSVLSGQQKRALLKVEAKQIENIQKKQVAKTVVVVGHTQPSIFPAKTVNILARKQFQEVLLKEIMFDLMVCEIEGWNKKDYINELKKLLSGIDTSNKKKAPTSQKDLFSTPE
jgi:hypothetical protein